LNVPGEIGDPDVTVFVTTYRSGVVEDVIRDASGTPTGQSNYFNALIAVDTFEFDINAATAATRIDFNDPAFADDAAVANTDGTAFDAIFAVRFETDTGIAVVLDDVFVTL